MLALHHAHLDVDGVVFDARLNRHRLEGEVAVVLIQRTQIEPFWVHKDPRFEAFQIVDVSAVDAQNGIELRAAVLRIAGKRNLAKMELVAFADVDFNPHQALGQPVNGIPQNPRVPVPLFVVETDDFAVRLVEVGLDEFA